MAARKPEVVAEDETAEAAVPPVVVADVTGLHAALDKFLADAEAEFHKLSADAVTEIRLRVTQIRNLLHSL